MEWTDVGGMTQEDIILAELEDFDQSEALRWMRTGERYYRVENEAIAARKMIRYDRGVAVSDETQPNHKLAHGFVHGMVDDKVAYLLSKEFTLKCQQEDKDCIQRVREILGPEFQYQLIRMGYESANKGIGWFHVFVDAKGKFGYLKVPAEQCIPLWADDEHSGLEAMIRRYTVTAYEGKARKAITKVEYHTTDAVTYYQLKDGTLIPDLDVELGESQGGHYRKNNQWQSWGRVPFVPFKNNFLELPDVKFVKTLIDAYDLSRSDNANFLTQLKRLYWVLKGYGGTDLAEFRKNLDYYGAIEIDDDDGGVEAVNPTIDLGGFDTHFKQLKQDILEGGQGVNKNLDSLGTAPSGIALKFLYSGLDLKCNLTEAEFLRGFSQLLYFVDRYLTDTQGVGLPHQVSIVFNRDIVINETEAIANCQGSKGVISDETILEQHPWVGDVETERERLKTEARARTEVYDRIPLTGDGHE